MKSVLIGLLFFVTFPQFIFAAESKEIKFKSRDLQKVKEEMDRKKEEQNKLKRETEDLSNEVKQSELHLKNVEQVLSLNRRKSSEVSQNMALTKNQHDSVLNNIDSQSQSLNKSLQTYYVASLLSGPQCPSSVFSRVVIKSQSTKLNDFKSESKSI
jgi:septal ring factor EnvC (AmiA/AmiB activator)